MIDMTEEQLVALFRVWKRAPIYISKADADADKRQPFEDFLKGAQPTFGMDSAITIQWVGMWLAIEKDGYTHS